MIDNPSQINKEIVKLLQWLLLYHSPYELVAYVHTS